MIREVKHEELSVCADMIRKSFQTVADEFGFTRENAPRFTAFATTEERLVWQMDSEHRLMFLAEEGNVICGYYSLLLRDENECELGSLSVLPEYRHRGIGGELLQHAMKTAREQNRTVISLSIVEENAVLRKWYEGYGAIHTGTRKFDFFPFTCGYMKIMLPGTKKMNFSIIEGADRMDTDEVVRLLKTTYWAGKRSKEQIRKSMDHSSCYGVYMDDERKLVGFARVISDFATTYYLADVIIDQDYRHRGLGKALVSYIVSLPEYAGLRGLLLTKDAHGLYEKYGFVSAEGRAMVKSPNP
jgi:N-acetylglutamate synthase-like GNAT family acetyltransferase